MTETAAFRIYKGYQSPYSLGLATTTPADPVPEVFDFLEDGFILQQEGGATNWIPTIAAPKEGVWADSTTQDGRTLLIKPMANATETFQLVSQNRATANAALSTLNWFGQAARDFWAGVSQDPVYVEWAALGGVGSQWALIYSLEASLVEAETIAEAALTEAITLSVAFEREPAWRGIEPGVSPKIWAMREVRGLLPTTTNPAPAGFFGYDNLDLGSGSGDYAPLVTANVIQGDELGTANVNYIDIDEALIPGDAPALCQISWDINGTLAVSGEFNSKVWFSRQIRRDLYPTTNPATGLTALVRARMTLNAGDATAGAPTNITITKPVTADGWLSFASIVNRYVAQLAFAAGAAGNTNALSWTLRYSQYGGRYAVFMRHTLTAGVATNIGVQLTATLPNATTIALNEVTLNATIAAARGGLIYLGELNVPYQRYVDTDGTGLNNTQNITFNLIFYKRGATTPTLLVWDISLMPIDYGTALSQAASVIVPYYDTTGYINLSGVGASSGISGNRPYNITGQAITLTPKIDNRIYFLNDSIGGTFLPATAIRAGVDIVPRWYGVRDQ